MSGSLDATPPARIAVRACARPTDDDADDAGRGLSDAAKRVALGKRGLGTLRFAARAIPVPGGL